VNGDGRDDIIVGATVNGHVKVFDGRTNAAIRSFLAYPGFLGGVNVAAGDVNGDGRAEIITGAGPGAPRGHVKVFSGVDSALLASFYAFNTAFSGGVFVASGDINGDGRADILTGAGPGTAPSGSTSGVWFLKNAND
jgi:trimeric autotransporter adhesin